MISAAQFNASSSAGKHWVAIDGSVYDVSSWCHAHPGGQLVLLHSTARDASEAFHAYHPAWVRHRLPAFKIGQLATAPPLPGTSATAQPTTHSTKAEPTANKRMVDEVKSDRKGPQQYTGANADRLKQVQRALEAQGLFTTSAGFYSKLALSCLACLALAIWCVVHQYITLGALLLGLFWQQVAFVGHDAGHNAVAHNSKYDGYIGLLVNACIGIGPSWWKATHNVHHLVVNSVDCDPDIQFMPLLAISPCFFTPLFSRYHNVLLEFDGAAKVLIPYQHFTFIPLLMVAKFGLYLQSVKQLMHGHCYINRTWEACTQLFFFAWNVALLRCAQGWTARLQLLLISHAAFFLLHLQVSGTMNWSCPAWLDWLHGGLQFQIEHHLFPSLPRHNLRQASLLVRPLCQDMGLPYHCPSFFGAIQETLATLKNAADAASKFTACTTHQGFSNSKTWEVITSAG
ncbi:hypothetical protein ABBQ32_007988 [Trebouxia sp. C0010 RCD-2024]